MRLSDIKGERVFDVIADIIEPCCNIMQDEDSASLFKGKRPDGMDMREFAIAKVKRAVPSLMHSHKDDLIAILSALEGIDAGEYREELTMPKLIQGIYEMVTDEDLLSFLS